MAELIAHLIHGSSEGRFSVTYCVGQGLSDDETWDDWTKLRPRDHEAFVQAISMRLHVPEVIALTLYSRS